MDENNDEQQLEETSLKKLQEDLDVANGNWKRALADFENYKRRKEQENKELVEFAREVTVAKLLPTIDSLEQALKHLPQYTTPSANAATPPILGGEAPQLSQGSSAELQSSPPSIGGVPTAGGGGGSDFPKQFQNWQAGVNGIVIQLDKVLGELGVKKIEALGKKFDPNFHEAVREVESESDDGTIVEELQTGFELNGKVIRPSQVVISKKK